MLNFLYTFAVVLIDIQDWFWLLTNFCASVLKENANNNTAIMIT